ncbi:MAG: HAMP domain-containing sensor histidine kinase [Minicystis sp.]
MSGLAVAPSVEGLVQARELHSWDRFLRWRPFVFVPGAVALTALLFLDPSPWRGPLMACGDALLIVFLLYERRRRRRATGPITGSLVVPMILQMAPILATGGLDSPFLTLLTVLALYAGAQAVRPAIVAAQCALIWSMGALQIRGVPPELLPRIFGGAAHAHTPLLVLATALCLTLVGFVSYWVGRTLRHGYDAAMAESVRARDEVVRQGAAHARELQVVCGEISHELKNPLATIRGLVELMALDAPTPRNAERLAVLLREAVRMQSSLEDLLDLARPLSPLDLAPVNLAALRAEVCSLHEGMSAAADVALSAPALAGEPRVVRGDFRKLRQVLVNLVQNAIEASSPGAAVTVAVRDGEGGAIVEVEDEGAGIEPALGDRVFEPGVTTKARGNGIGLTIARAIARQHGGDVVLRPRSPRGCVAALILPAERPAAGEVAA